MRGPWNTLIRVNAGPAFGGGVKADNVMARVVPADAVLPIPNGLGYLAWVTMPLDTPVRGGQDSAHGLFDVTKMDRIFDIGRGVIVGNVLYCEQWTWLAQDPYMRAYIDAGDPPVTPISTPCCFAGVPRSLTLTVIAPTADPNLLGLTYVLTWDAILHWWAGSTLDGLGRTVSAVLMCDPPWFGTFGVNMGGPTFHYSMASSCGPTIGVADNVGTGDPIVTFKITT